MAIGEHLQKYTYAWLMQEGLRVTPDTVDHREGSIIFDALGPKCYRLAEFFYNLWLMSQETYILTASGEYLDSRAIEVGLTRYQATSAVKRGDFAGPDGLPVSIPIGSRWASFSTTTPLIYVVKSVYTVSGGGVAGAYILECETPGVLGHIYTGNIRPIDFVTEVNGGSAVISTTITPGRDRETDDQFRQRYLDRVNVRPFGGNIAQYRAWLQETPGVGAVQIYPVWNGGGTVKLSVVDTTYMPITTEFIKILWDMIDPENAVGVRGDGLGIAPINHKVTVTTPTVVSINFSAKVTPMHGFTLPQLVPAIETALDSYVANLRETWGVGTPLNEYFTVLYIARAMQAIINVDGVSNVTDLKINGSSIDVVLTQTGLVQELPVLGTVTISA